MNIKDNGPENDAKLRQRAEEIVQRKEGPSPENLETVSHEETRRIIHELRVYQIELKMQNDELRRAHAELEAARVRYFDLYNLAPVGYLIVSREGLILEVNLAAVNLLASARAVLIKKPITRFILEQDLGIYYQHRKQLWVTGKPDACELRMMKNDGTTFWTHLTTTAAQDAEGAPVYYSVLSNITEREREQK
ncbi:MAG: PAS domain-containing protein [Deltaproteobacteria bacterium]|nr:PAS domain-containing protein [Deltaproteobacteria bacterium]